jgi:hypothetical protein
MKLFRRNLSEVEGGGRRLLEIIRTAQRSSKMHGIDQEWKEVIEGYLE